MDPHFEEYEEQVESVYFNDNVLEVDNSGVGAEDDDLDLGPARINDNSYCYQTNISSYVLFVNCY